MTMKLFTALITLFKIIGKIY